VMAQFFGQNRQRTHECAANTKNMNVHSRPRKSSAKGSVEHCFSHSLAERALQKKRFDSFSIPPPPLGVIDLSLLLVPLT
jgi:trehalose-6-phosphatase